MPSMSLQQAMPSELGGFDPRYPLVFLNPSNDADCPVILTSIQNPEKLRGQFTRVKLELGEESAFRFLLAASTFSHEYRHYPQFLTSPTACFIFRQRLRQAACHVRMPYRLWTWVRSRYR